tara:strand:- start:47 stop:910 length:864 start_codon:yes stop_codon:yes gene_type:complete
MSKKAYLGKGLEALISQYSTEENDAQLNNSIPLSKIRPNKNQPRKDFDSQKMEELTLSIKEKGILQPIAVRELKDGLYEIIAGERRYRAAKEIGLKSIPAYVISINKEAEVMEYALIENIQRDNLNPIEASEGFEVLRNKYRLSQKEIAKRVGKSRSVIANSLRLLNLPNSIKDDVREHRISTGHAILLLSLKSKTKMLAVCNRIKNKKISVRETESLILKMNKTSSLKSKKLNTSQSKILIELENKLIHKYGTKASILSRNKSKGKIVFEYYSKDDLQRILDLLIK